MDEENIVREETKKKKGQTNESGETEKRDEKFEI